MSMSKLSYKPGRSPKSWNPFRRGSNYLPSKSVVGVDAGTGDAGESNLIGGVGLKGVPSPVPTIETPDRTSIDPGLTRAPVYDLVQVDAYRENARAQAPMLKLEALGKLQKVEDSAYASPGAARELGQLEADLGFPERGKVTTTVRAPERLFQGGQATGQPPYNVPGMAPAVPGGPSLPAADNLMDKAKAIGTIITHTMKTGVPFEGAKGATLAHVAQAERANFLQQMDQAYQLARAFTPHGNPYDTLKSMLGAGGLFSPELGAEQELQKLGAKYDVETAREPGLIAAKGAAELQQFRNKMPYEVQLAGQKSYTQAANHEKGTVDVQTSRRADINQNAREKAENQGIGQALGTKEGEAQAYADPTVGPVIARGKAAEEAAKTKARNQENAGKGLTEAQYWQERHKAFSELTRNPKMSRNARDFLKLKPEEQDREVDDLLESRGVRRPGSENESPQDKVIRILLRGRRAT